MASQVLALPECVAFQSKENGKYLRYVHESGKAHKLLHMSGEDALNPFTRFCVEPSREHAGLVHIRCCYNNKYWVARKVDGKWWVHGDANERVEDPSNPCSTLFKPILTEDSLACSLIHRQLGKEALMFTGTGTGTAKAEEADHLKGRCLHVQAEGDADAGAIAVAMFVVSEQEAVLPRNVCFLGDNGKYLRAVVREGYPYQEYSSDDMGASDVRNLTETNHDGRIRISSVRFGKFWRRSPNWIWADANSDSWGNPDTQFRAVRVDGDGDGVFFALRNLGNNKFCKRLTTEGKESCLNAAADTITREARMRIREIVFSRTIDEVEYQVKDAKIYGRTVLAIDSAQGANTTDSSHTLSLSFKKVTTEQRTWNSSVTLKLGVSTSVKAGVPLIADGKITVSTEFSGSYSWGTTKVLTQESSVTYQVAVPPRTKVTVNLLATQATYDVPFYYRQKDVLTDGTTETSNLRDGVYTGVNAYDFKYETKEEKL